MYFDPTERDGKMSESKIGMSLGKNNSIHALARGAEEMCGRFVAALDSKAACLCLQDLRQYFASCVDA